MSPEYPTEPIPGYTNGEFLLRVVPVVQSGDIEHGKITLSCIEVYEDGGRVHYISVANEPRSFDLLARRRKAPTKRSSKEQIEKYLAEQEQIFGLDLSLHLQDDLETPYTSFPGASSGNHRVSHGTISFTPRVPESARRLALVVYESDWYWTGEHAGCKRRGQPSFQVELDL